MGCGGAGPHSPGFLLSKGREAAGQVRAWAKGLTAKLIGIPSVGDGEPPRRIYQESWDNVGAGWVGGGPASRSMGLRSNSEAELETGWLIRSSGALPEEELRGLGQVSQPQEAASLLPWTPNPDDSGVAPYHDTL